MIECHTFSILKSMLFFSEDPRGCGGCVGHLSLTISACIADVVDWPLVVACVSGIIGVEDACNDCICWVIEYLYDVVAC